MSYDYYTNVQEKYDESISGGIYPTSPSLSALQEIILISLKELAYYLLKLKEFGATNDVIKENIIEAILGLITNIEHNEAQFQKLVILLAQDLSQAKTIYAELSKKNNIEPTFLKSYFKHTDDLNLAEIVKKGEKYFILRNASYTTEQKNLFDIMLLLIKNTCLKIIQIKSYQKNYEKAYDSILNLLNTMNFENITTDTVKSAIENGIIEYHNIVKILSDAQEETYGQRESVYIPFTPRTGKAILVSGIDMPQLEAVLKAAQKKEVDVYTHGMTMLMAHTLPKFKNYPNLVGHFGKYLDNSLFDFAAFPGAILTTRYLFQKVGYLCRGRLFTTDPFAPSGIVKIKDNNFEPLIQAALDAKGFTKKQQEVIHRVGFRQKVLEEKVDELISKMEKKEIKHLYFIGILRNENEYKEYFDRFLKIMPKDCYAVSLAHARDEENVLHIDSFYDYLLIYKILEKFNEKKPLKKLNITIFITKCDQYTITNVINFINMGVKNIFLCKCLPIIVNPSLISTMQDTFGINKFSTPEEDLAKTLSK